MKRVSYNIAKVIKEAGYPQNMVGGYYSEICKPEVRGIFADKIVQDTMYAAPTYIEVWLWLWRKKGIYIETEGGVCTVYSPNIATEFIYQKNYRHCLYDPETVISEAIDSLADNHLIK